MDVGSSVSLGSPLNMAHPLNRGLTFHWLCLPGYMGGVKVVDLVKKTSLTRSFRAGSNYPLWSGSLARSGGRGSLRFQGTGDRIALSVIGTTTFTYAVWIRPAVLSGFQSVLITSGSYGFFLSGAVLHFYPYTVSPTSLTALVWSHVAVSVSSGTGTYYINGKAEGTFSGLASNTFVEIGTDSSNEHFTGYMDDGRLYVGRALSASEMRELYTESRRGYPTMLNRSSPFKIPMMGVSGGSPAAGAGSIFQGRTLGRGRILGGSALVC